MFDVGPRSSFNAAKSKARTENFTACGSCSNDGRLALARLEFTAVFARSSSACWAAVHASRFRRARLAYHRVAAGPTTGMFLARCCR